MTAYVALLRAVNVGGTGKLPMAELKAMGEACGFTGVRTFIASGNLLFGSDLGEQAVQRQIAQRLEGYAGKPVGVVVRSSGEMAQVLADNPFQDEAPNATVAIFLDAAPPADALDHARGVAGERMALGRREIYVRYGAGMGDSKLHIPAAVAGTARNINTVRKIAALLAAEPISPA